MISVCMASHNGERYIKQQIESILSQLGVDDELIISDDGSTDATIAIIESFLDSRIQLLHYTYATERKHRYASTTYKVTANFENALKHAKGDYIFLSDQDDIWSCERVKVILPLLIRYALVESNNSIIDDKGNVIIEREFDTTPITFRGLFRLPFRGCCCAFRREVLEMALPFPEDCIMHDAWIGLVAHIICGSTYFENRSLIAYRRYDGNVSSEKGKSKNPLFFRVQFRIKLFIQLAWRWWQIWKKDCNFILSSDR